jgi:hypothetical protein
MTVKELIAALSKQDPNARVFMGYDGNVVVTESDEVEGISCEWQIGDCWFSVKPGDVVILCAEPSRPRVRHVAPRTIA